MLIITFFEWKGMCGRYGRYARQLLRAIAMKLANLMKVEDKTEIKL